MKATMGPIEYFRANAFNASAPESLVSEFHSSLLEIGFSSFDLMRIRAPSAHITSRLICSTGPDDWVDYNLKNQHRLDPLAQELFRTYRPFSWDDIERSGDASQVLLNELRRRQRWGIKNGFIVPMFGGWRPCAYITIVSNSMISVRQRNVLWEASVLFYQRYAALGIDKLREPNPLSEPELACLRLVAAGNSDWQIGAILGLSAKTANYRVESAKRKLNLATRIQAVVWLMQEDFLP